MLLSDRTKTGKKIQSTQKCVQGPNGAGFPIRRTSPKDEAGLTGERDPIRIVVDPVVWTVRWVGWALKRSAVTGSSRIGTQEAGLEAGVLQRLDALLGVVADIVDALRDRITLEIPHTAILQNFLDSAEVLVLRI